MTGAPWFKCYPRDFNDGMVGLTLEERGAYVTILNLIYSRGGPIPEDKWWITSQLGCTARTWVKVRAALILKRKLFEVVYNGSPSLMNGRAAHEIAEFSETSRKFSEAGAKGGRNSAAKRNEINAEPEAKLEAGLSQAQPYQISEPEQVSEAIASSSPKGDSDYPSDFEAAWKAYPHVKGRSSKSKSLGYWRRLSAPRRALLPAAIARYAKEGREPREDCGAPAMERWLRDTRYLDWLEASQVAASTWTGPPEIRTALADALGEEFARSYLDPCAWQDVPERGVIPRTNLGADKLRKSALALLEGCGVQIIERTAA